MAWELGESVRKDENKGVQGQRESYGNGKGKD